MIRKLQQRGDVSEGRITELEGQMQERVKSSISQQIAARIRNLETMLENSVKREVKKKSGSWIVPFVILSVLLSGVFYYVYVVEIVKELCIETVQADPEDTYALSCLFILRCY